MNNRKSPLKQQRPKNAHSTPVVPNANHMRAKSSMAPLNSKNFNSQSRYYSKSTSPTVMPVHSSSSSPPAVPIFYSNTYVDPPECSSLPQPPESWYLKANDENLSRPIVEEKVQVKPKFHSKNSNNRGYYNPFYPSRIQTSYISVKA